MKRVIGTSSVFAVVTTTLLSVLWQAGPGHCCISGRYGSYDKWPSSNDLEELLVLLTGKYGKNGWGWQSTDSYAYSTMGDYPLGNLKYSSSPWGSSGSSGGGGSSGSFSSFPSSGSNSLSGNSYSSGSSGGSKHETFKEAINTYFKSQPTGNTYGSGGGGGGGGGFVGESFIDSPRPGPPYDDSPGPGPPYPPSSHDNSGGGLPAFGPPYETSSSWKGGGGGSSGFGSGPPGPSTGGNGHQSSWPLPQSSSEQSGPPPMSHSSNELGGGFRGAGDSGEGNQFQSDHDVFGGGAGGQFGKKRRQGRRRFHVSQPSQPQPPQPKPRQQQYARQKQNSQPQTKKPPQRQRQRQRQAGLRSKPVVTPSNKKPYKFPPYPGAKKTRRMGFPLFLRRRLLNTSFGGYKVDHSRLRSLS